MCAPAMERKQKTQKDPAVQVLSDDRAEAEGEKTSTCMAVEMPLILPMIEACLSLCLVRSMPIDSQTHAVSMVLKSWSAAQRNHPGLLV